MAQPGVIITLNTEGTGGMSLSDAVRRFSRAHDCALVEVSRRQFGASACYSSLLRRLLLRYRFTLTTLTTLAPLVFTTRTTRALPRARTSASCATLRVIIFLWSPRRLPCSPC
jgi:hypothetical protein